MIESVYGDYLLFTNHGIYHQTSVVCSVFLLTKLTWVVNELLISECYIKVHSRRLFMYESFLEARNSQLCCVEGTSVKEKRITRVKKDQ